MSTTVEEQKGGIIITTKQKKRYQIKSVHVKNTTSAQCDMFPI